MIGLLRGYVSLDAVSLSSESSAEPHRNALRRAFEPPHASEGTRGDPGEAQGC
jgi:hypothetical protein